MLEECGGCGTRFAPDLERCPHCGQERAGDVAKIVKGTGPTFPEAQEHVAADELEIMRAVLAEASSDLPEDAQAPDAAPEPAPPPRVPPRVPPRLAPPEVPGE